jgi:hypothetical protein
VKNMAPLRNHKRHFDKYDYSFVPLIIFVVINLVWRYVAALVKQIVGHGRMGRDAERELFRRSLPVWQRPVYNWSRTTDELIWNPQGRSGSSVARAGDLPRLPLRVPDPVHFPAGQPTRARYVDTLECVVCTERKPRAGNFPTRRITMACDHDPHVCLECLERSIQSNLQGRFWDQVSCPECSRGLQHDDVRDFATTEMFERYLPICRA